MHAVRAMPSLLAEIPLTLLLDCIASGSMQENVYLSITKSRMQKIMSNSV